MATKISAYELTNYLGKEVGVSDWFLITQEQINQFGQSTHDTQFIHCDPDKAKSSPFGGTIAHGFLSMSLLSAMAYQAGLDLDETLMGLNYGFDKVRFLQPVKVNQRVRGKMKLLDVIEKQPKQFLFTWQVTIEIENEEKPALIAVWLTMTITN